MQFGEYEVKSIEMGTFRLDGGAMFGHVPRTLWSKKLEPDDQNRVKLALRCLFVDGFGRRILIDTGIGDKWDSKSMGMFDIQPPEGGLAGELKRKTGLTPDQITDVVLTHLHFDHAGGVTCRNEDGEVVPTFPNALVHLQRRNLEWARKPNPKERASYLPDNFEPLAAADRFVLHDGSRDLFPDFTLLTSDGHTEGLQMVRIRGPEAALYYCADVIPTRAHVRLPYCMGYDNSALRVIQEKEPLLKEAAAQGHWVCYEHDPEVAASRIQLTDGKFEPVDCVAEL
jgi:glyoxylase-like metal-dependent hydrolase (beta-lactamase superfamily II)